MLRNLYVSASGSRSFEEFRYDKMQPCDVLKGKWGTGETFIWNDVIEVHFLDFSRSNYAYVSLFGLSSLADLERAIFTNIVKPEKAGKIAEF
jgi:hypothetical protein